MEVESPCIGVCKIDKKKKFVLDVLEQLTKLVIGLN